MFLSVINRLSSLLKILLVSKTIFNIFKYASRRSCFCERLYLCDFNRFPDNKLTLFGNLMI